MRLLPFVPRFRRAYREMKAMAEREQWSRADIDAYQLQRLNVVWRHAVQHVPYYRTLAAAQNLPLQFAGLNEFRSSMPILDKRDVRERCSEFVSENPAKGSWMRTGGSTGTPMNIYWGREAYLETLRSRYRCYESWGVDFLDRCVLLWGHSASLKPGWRGWLNRLRRPVEDWLRNRLRLSAYHLGDADLRGNLKRIAKFRPVVLYGYCRAVHLLAQEAKRIRFRNESLKLIQLTGEPVFPHLAAEVEETFGVPVVTEYGSTECNVIASEGPDRALRVREDTTLVETVPREDGRFDIVVTMLNNPSFPLLRYAIDDITDAPLQQPEQGFSILQNVAGRNNDLVYTRSRRQIHSARFDAFFKYECRHVRRFHVHQHADGNLSVQLEMDKSSPFLNLKRVERKLSELVEGYRVDAEIVDTFPQTAAGKHRLVVSDLDPMYLPTNPSNSYSPVANGGLTSAPRRKADLANETVRTEAASRRADDEHKATKLRQLIQKPELSFLLEAHDGLSAKIVEEAGFDGIWASGLAMSASLGVRDANEASWTQVLDLLEFMSDATRIPILLDGDTGYGNFNNVRRLVQKLEQRSIAGVCLEDKTFPKTNSFCNGEAQPLADIDEFCGKIKAGKDSQSHDDFVIVARIEAFIAGRGLDEALRRAEAYHEAGADAILIHSSRPNPAEVIAFKKSWGNRSPVVIVPTKYYTTPTDVFRRHGFSAVIWANHLMRACITAMQTVAERIRSGETVRHIEEHIATIAEVFRLQNAAELSKAEEIYLPKSEPTHQSDEDGAIVHDPR